MWSPFVGLQLQEKYPHPITLKGEVFQYPDIFNIYHLCGKEVKSFGHHLASGITFFSNLVG